MESGSRASLRWRSQARAFEELWSPKAVARQMNDVQGLRSSANASGTSTMDPVGGHKACRASGVIIPHDSAREEDSARRGEIYSVARTQTLVSSFIVSITCIRSSSDIAMHP